MLCWLNHASRLEVSAAFEGKSNAYGVASLARPLAMPKFVSWILHNRRVLAAQALRLGTIFTAIDPLTHSERTLVLQVRTNGWARRPYSVQCGVHALLAATMIKPICC